MPVDSPVYRIVVSGNTATWIDDTPMPMLSGHHTASVLNDGRILVAGGKSTHSSTSAVLLGSNALTSIVWFHHTGARA